MVAVNTTISNICLQIAVDAHKGIFRKGSKEQKEEYINHPIRVGELIKEYCDVDWVVGVAYLHDTIEDVFNGNVQMLITMLLQHGIEQNTAATIAWGVKDLSNCFEGTQAEKNILYTKQLCGAAPLIKQIKYADIYDNCKDVVEVLGKKWGIKYLNAKKLQLEQIYDSNCNFELFLKASWAIQKHFENE